MGRQETTALDRVVAASAAVRRAHSEEPAYPATLRDSPKVRTAQTSAGSAAVPRSAPDAANQKENLGQGQREQAHARARQVTQHLAGAPPNTRNRSPALVAQPRPTSVLNVALTQSAVLARICRFRTTARYARRYRWQRRRIRTQGFRMRVRQPARGQPAAHYQ